MSYFILFIFIVNKLIN